VPKDQSSSMLQNSYTPQIKAPSKALNEQATWLWNNNNTRKARKVRRDLALIQ